VSDHGVPNDERPHTMLPNPDPSRLTTEQLHRELHLLERALMTRIQAANAAYIELKENLVRVPTILDREIERLTQLTDEKFRNVDTRFGERDLRGRDRELSNKTAIDKSEEGVKDQLHAITAVVGSNDKAMADKLESVKEVMAASYKALDDKITTNATRISELLSSQRGVREDRTDKRMDLGAVLGVMSIGFVGLTLVVGAVLYVSNRQNHDVQVPVYVQPALPTPPIYIQPTPTLKATP
jgi:hypothetical protein